MILLIKSSKQAKVTGVPEDRILTVHTAGSSGRQAGKGWER